MLYSILKFKTCCIVEIYLLILLIETTEVSAANGISELQRSKVMRLRCVSIFMRCVSMTREPYNDCATVRSGQSYLHSFISPSVVFKVTQCEQLLHKNDKCPQK